ncbi:MAG: hypothetical protein K2Y21_13720 [Phycisphaerales bacterium]|nr:hypothetical protein [Phycisphaerales bacterium]
MIGESLRSLLHSSAPLAPAWLLSSDRGSVGRGFALLMFLLLGTIVVLAVVVLFLQSRRRAHLRNLAEDTKRRRSEDPWKVSADRTEAPSADELYRASGFDKDDTRIEDSPQDPDRNPDEPRA